MLRIHNINVSGILRNEKNKGDLFQDNYRHFCWGKYRKLKLLKLKLIILCRIF